MPLASDAAYREIKSWIQTGRVAPGHLIDESEAVKELGMSRTPVREALLRLQAEGYIEIRRNKGIRVLPLSAGDMREIYQVISALEGTAVGLIADRRPPAEAFRALEEAVAQLEEYQESQDVEKWGTADELFHRELMRLSGNEKLYAVGCQLARFRQARALGRAAHADRRLSRALHAQPCDAAQGIARIPSGAGRRTAPGAAQARRGRARRRGGEVPPDVAVVGNRGRNTTAAGRLRQAYCAR